MPTTLRSLILAAPVLALSTPALAVEATVMPGSSVTQAEVEAAQIAWGDAVVAIDAAATDEEARALADGLLDDIYGFEFGPILFKPTLTQVPQTFRDSKQGALSYFVGQDAAYPKDSGFARKGWVKVEIENAAIFIAGDTAQTIGKVHFTNEDGGVVSVDKTWGFLKDGSGSLQMILHHSSLPYAPE